MKLSLSSSRKVTTVLYPEDTTIPENEKIAFQIKPLSNKDVTAIQNILSYGTDGTVKVNFGDMKTEKVKRGVLGWKNLQDDNGTEVPFSDDNLLNLPPQVLSFLLNKINEVSNFKDDKAMANFF